MLLTLTPSVVLVVVMVFGGGAATIASMLDVISVSKLVLNLNSLSLIKALLL